MKRKAALTDHDNAKAQNVESLTAYFGRLSLDDPNPGPHAFQVLSQWTRAYPERFRPPPISTIGFGANPIFWRQFLRIWPSEDSQSANLVNDIRTGHYLGDPLIPLPATATQDQRELARYHELERRWEQMGRLG